MSTKKIDEAILKDGILNLIEKKPSTSFVELETIDGFKGNSAMWLPEYKIILWIGMSEKAVMVMSDLIQSKQIAPVPCRELIYMMDGKTVNLPLAKTDRKYVKDRWLPVVFNLGKEADNH